MRAATAQGLFDHAITEPASATRVRSLIRFLKSENRLEEELTFVRFYVDCGQSVDETIDVLMDLLGRAQKGILKGLALFEAATYSIQKQLPGAKWQQLEQAQALLLEHGHGHIDIDTRHLRAAYTRDGHSDQHARSSTLRAICEEYFGRCCYLKGIACLSSIIISDLQTGVYIEQAFNDLARQDEILVVVGGEFIRQGQYIQSLAQALLQSPHYGDALKSLELFFEQPRHKFGPRNKAFLLLYLRQAYEGLGKVAKALNCAQLALAEFESLYYYEDRSDAALHVGLAKAAYRRQFEAGSDEERHWLNESIRHFAEWAEHDRNHGYIDGEHDKCEQAALLEDYQRETFNEHEALTRAQNWVQRAEQLGTGKPGVVLKSFVDLKVRQLIATGDFEGAIKLSMETYTSLAAGSGSTYQLAQALVRIATSLNLRLIDDIERNGTEYRADSPHAIQLLEIAKYNAQGLATYQSAGEPEVVVSCTNYYIGALQQYTEYAPESLSVCMKDALTKIQQAESLCDRSRRSLTIVGGLSSLLLKRQLVSHHEHRKLYQRAVNVCLALENPEMAWEWIQKGKARSLSDMFGARALMPNSLVKQIQASPEAFKLFQAEQTQNQEAQHANHASCLGLSRQVELLRQQMRTVPILAQLLDIREGAFDITAINTNFDKALNWTGLKPSAVKYVDWFVPQQKHGVPDKILMFVRTLDGTTKFHCLPISMQALEHWVTKNLHFPPYATAPLRRPNGNHILAELNGLLHGLDQDTEKGDLLILSPSGILQSLPLHGLRIGGEPLIARNLVVYSSSAAVFRQCLDRATAQAVARDVESTFFGVYEETSKQRVVERAEIFTSIQRSSAYLNGDVFTGSSVTKDKFFNHSQVTQWLHYHGHATYDSEDVTKSALVLSTPRIYGQDSDAQSSMDSLTVREAFDMNMFDNAPHLTIIACDSGSQNIGAGDEPLGLLSAFLYAGATSIIGCLWPVESFAGRTFSELFYKDLGKQISAFTHDGTSINVLNIAAAYRQASLQMMAKEARETRLPFFWAPFVLHGVWFRTWNTSLAGQGVFSSEVR